MTRSPWTSLLRDSQLSVFLSKAWDRALRGSLGPTTALVQPESGSEAQSTLLGVKGRLCLLREGTPAARGHREEGVDRNRRWCRSPGPPPVPLCTPCGPAREGISPGRAPQTLTALRTTASPACPLLPAIRAGRSCAKAALEAFVSGDRWGGSVRKRLINHQNVFPKQAHQRSRQCVRCPLRQTPFGCAWC